MSNVVREFIQNHENKILMVKEKEKKDLLYELGLFEREYSDSDKYNPEYPYFDDSEQKYFKRVDIIITDDEYEKLRQVTKRLDRNKNKISILMIVIAITIYTIGFFYGFYAGGTVGYLSSYFSLPIAFTVWLSAFSTGSVFLAIGEIVQLLNDIQNK